MEHQDSSSTVKAGSAAAERGADGRKSAKTLIEYAYQSLRRDIINGTLAPGSKLRIEQLRQTYEIGSSTLREALTLLMSDALVTAEGQRGFTVAPISMDDLRDICRLRKLMETMALRDSIALGDDHWEAGVVAAFHRLSLVEERLDRDIAEVAACWEERNRAFHEALIDACPSRWLRHFRAMLYAQSERYRHFVLVARDGRRDIHDEHRAIMEAALARNADLACQLIEVHIDRTLDATLRLRDLPDQG